MASNKTPLSTSPAAAVAAPGLFTQVGMAGTAAVITVSFIHPIDVVKVSLKPPEDSYLCFCALPVPLE